MNNEIKKEVLDVLSLDPIKQKDICRELEQKGINLEPRILRKYFKDINNDLFMARLILLLYQINMEHIKANLKKIFVYSTKIKSSMQRASYGQLIM